MFAEDYNSYHENYKRYLHRMILERKENFLKKLQSIIGPIYVNDFAKTLEYSYNEEVPEAKSLAEDLGFSKLDFYAYCDEYNLFIEEYEKEKEIEEFEARYDY